MAGRSSFSTLRNRMPPEAQERARAKSEALESEMALAEGTRRSRSFLAAEAVETYVDRELAIIEGIQRGVADVAAGRTVSHEEAMAAVQQAVARS